MKLTEKLLDLLEALKYKKEDNSHGYDLTAKSPYGEVLIRVHASDYGNAVFAVEVGDARLFDAEGDSDTLRESQAKSLVDSFIKSRKFNPEKWLKSSKYVDRFLKGLDSGKYKKPIERAKDSKHLLSTLLQAIMDEVTYYGNYVDNEVPHLADDLLLDFFRSDKARQIMFSKVSRLVTKGSGEFKKRFGSSEFFRGSHSGKSDDDILDKAIDKIIAKSGSTSDDDFWAEMMGNQSIRQKLLKLKGK